MRRRLALLPLVLGLPAVLPQLAPAAVSLQSIGPTFDGPVYVTAAPGDDRRLYVVEQRGTIQVVQDGTAATFLDLQGAVRSPDDGGGGEQGLLGLAFAPDFQASRLLYVYFTEASGANRVEQLRAPTGDAVDPATRRLVLAIPHPSAENHNGGTLRFGPADGLLYLAPGDGGTGGAPARDLDDLRGKVLRIDPRGSTPGQYGIPADNPFAGQAGRRGEIWAYGLRNPYRFAFDRLTGDLLIGDVGEGTTEELDWLPAASGGGKGADLGWNRCEGSFEVGTTTPCTSMPGAVRPVLDRAHADGYRSIIAGPVVRDPSLPSLQGRLLYGDFFVRALRSAQLGGGGASDDRAVGVEVPQLTSLGEDAAGCVYATSAAGAVYRLVEQDTRIPCALPPSPSPPPTAPLPPSARSTGGAAAGLLDGVRAKRRQRVLALGGPVVRVRCARRCRVAAGATLRVDRRAYRLRRVTAHAGAARAARLKPRLSRRGRRALRIALDAGRRPLVVVRVRARDGAGDRSPLVRRVVRAVG
jgi:hypothetical protein